MMQKIETETKAGLYIHVPFCRRKCDYCAFYSISPENGFIEKYLSRLQKEAFQKKNLVKSFSTVFVGGGNPAVLGVDGLKRLSEIIFETIGSESIDEWTFEANPESIESGIVDFFSTLPAIRLSIGIQRLKNEDLNILGRQSELCSIYRAMDMIFSKIKNVSTDFILGVPGCSLIGDDLRKFLQRYSLKHVSAYLLSIEENTPLEIAVKKGILSNPDDIGAEELFQVRDILLQYGFEHYEISNYALNGSRCLHNMNYWHQGDYLGLGPAAVSTVGSIRTSNPSDFGLWLETDDSDVEHLSTVDRRNEYSMLRLRLTTDGLDISELEKLYGLQPSEFYSELNKMATVGQIERSGSVIRFTDAGLIIADDIMARLFI